jgi:hypothetical protein
MKMKNRIMILPINDYAQHIHLFEPIIRPALLTAVEKKRTLHDLCAFFANEEQCAIPSAYSEQRLLPRSLLNIRAPKAISHEILQTLDHFLWTERIDLSIEHFDLSMKHYTNP